MAGAFTPNLKKKVIVPGAGHWVQQERPKEINQVLIEFLKGI
jgi:pimeloyl-ACP methyl ester carboxylesterase